MHGIYYFVNIGIDICRNFTLFLLNMYVFSKSFVQIVFTPGQQDKCFLCGQMGHLAADCEGKAKRKAGEFDEKGDENVVVKKPYQVGFHACEYLP